MVIQQGRRRRQYPQSTSAYIEDRLKSRTQLEILPVERAAPQNDLPTRPQAKKAPEAYPIGYVEDAFEARTQLEVVFSDC